VNLALSSTIFRAVSEKLWPLGPSPRRGGWKLAGGENPRNREIAFRTPEGRWNRGYGLNETALAFSLPSSTWERACRGKLCFPWRGCRRVDSGSPPNAESDCTFARIIPPQSRQVVECPHVLAGR
jgi:hypothetical protein